MGETQSILTQTSIATAANSLPTQNYSREDIGLTLKVKPRISADNKVSLEVSVISEDVIGGAAGQPTTTKREVTTSSIVMNGETVIIGGLSKDKVSDEMIKIPLLGDIPILGIPFRHTSTKHDKTSLVIMLTPYIVNKSEDLAALRNALGKLSILEDELALEFEQKHLNGKYIPQETISKPVSEVVKTENIEIQSEVVKPENIEIQIDDYGNSFEVILDSRGNEISRRQVPNNF